MARLSERRRLLPIDIALLVLFHSTRATAELFYTAVSPLPQDGLNNLAPSICPVAQDGYTYNTFPWTHNPTCVSVVLPSDDPEGGTKDETFCAYTNTNYNNGRGISFVVTPEVAASVNMETYGMAVGGLEGQIGEEMGMWEVKNTAEKGKGMFARKDIGTIFAGESIVLKTPVLFVAKQLLDTPSLGEAEQVIGTAIKQLPLETEKAVRNLVKVWGSDDAFNIVQTNGLAVKWPWADDVPELLTVTPEVARINHACRPNALSRFNDYSLTYEVFALREIKPGEEITMSYGFEQRAHRRRMRSIKANLGFDCRCPLCTASEEEIEASNDRLSEIKALKSVLPTDHADSPQLISLLPPLIKNLEEEGLIAELPMYEEILALTWSTFGIADRAKYWAGRARKHWAIIAGKESWEQRRCGDLEDDVKSHATWMTWEGDPWEGVGQGHPWDEREGDHDHDHDHAAGEKKQAIHEEDGEDLSGYDQRPERDQFRGHT